MIYESKRIKNIEGIEVYGVISHAGCNGCIFENQDKDKERKHKKCPYMNMCMGSKRVDLLSVIFKENI